MRRVAAAVLVTIFSVAASQAMPVSQFLPKAEALKKKGAMALFSSDLGLLKAEMSSAGTQLRDERLALAKAGGKPSYCPPAKAGFNPDELLAHLRSIPPAQRGMSFKAAFAMFLTKKFPCPA